MLGSVHTPASLSEVRVYVLRSTHFTEIILKFQYYPSAIFNPRLDLFANEMKRQLRLEGRPFWIYCYDDAAKRLAPIYGPRSRVDDRVFCRFIEHGFLRIFVEIEREFRESELSINIPTLPGARSIDDLKRDTQTDDYTKQMMQIASIRERVNSILEGTEFYAEYIDKAINGAKAIHTGMTCDKCGNQVEGVLEKCAVCSHKACVGCIPLLDHQQVHRGGTVMIAYPDCYHHRDAPECEKCRRKVSPLYYIDLRSFSVYCNEDGEMMIARREAREKDLFRIHCGALFKYQEAFLTLKREFPRVPDKRIKHLLYLNEGSEINVRYVLLSGL